MENFDITEETIISSLNGRSEQRYVNIDRFIDLLNKYWKSAIPNYLYWEFYIDHKNNTITFSCIVKKWLFFTLCEKKLTFKLYNSENIVIWKDINSNIIQEKSTFSQLPQAKALRLAIW